MKTTLLPIDSLLPTALKAMERSTSLILQASPGSGKTTRLPPYLLRNSKTLSQSQIWVLQPRKLAAQFAAARVAYEENERLGDWVGYHFRFEKKFSSQTRLLYLTEGMLMRRLIGNPTLEGVSVVVLDEFHERHLHTDLTLSFLRRLQRTVRPDLKIIVMSATLDLKSLTEFLPEAPLIHLESPIFPVETTYLSPSQTEKSLPRLVKDAVEKYFKASTQGDCLVFLPGLREIRSCETELSSLSRTLNFSLFALHGDFGKEDQEAALQPGEFRKVILSTNIAETSLTIPGINCVIDSGLQRIASYSWWTGLPLLSTKPNSKASSIQRAGRAGRTGPGFCFRLYTQHEFETKAPFETPEIRKSDLTQTALELKGLGVEDLSTFEWFEPPSKEALTSSEKLLFLLGALESTSSASPLTPLGEKMKQVSLHPRIARFLLECESSGCLEQGIRMAALISEGKLETLDALDQLKSPLDFSSERVKRQLEIMFHENNASLSVSASDKNAALAKALLSAFPDRMALAKSTESSKKLSLTATKDFVLASGGTASLIGNQLYSHSSSEPYVIALALQEIQRGVFSKVHLTSLVPIQEEWLFELSPCPIEDIEKVQWNRTKQKIEATSQLILGQIVLESRAREAKDENEVFSILVRELFKTSPQKLESLSLQDWVSLFNTLFPQQELETELTRLNISFNQMRFGKEVHGSNLLMFLRHWLDRKRSLKEIEVTSCIQNLRVFFLEGQEHTLERNCPSFILLPNQRKTPVHYPWDRAPWIESRMQDFFGMLEVPALCGGRVSLIVHLLAPNHRAVQVTSDLKSFWQNHYPKIRKELSRNYPKHSFPEDPYTPIPPSPRKRN
ncbi:MAG: ATP-dependent helicase HrpB [Deltaproteobacteria bacterium]|nr:ATP-dependent helicase HrpB [Deltaproteobacteria bacterium]